MTRLKPEAAMMTLDQALIQNTEERSPSSGQIATATAPNTKPTAVVILLGRKTDLILASARRYFGFGDKNDYVVLGGPRDRTDFQTATGPGQPPVVLDHYPHGISAIEPQQGLLSNAQRSDDGFQSAMVEPIGKSRTDIPYVPFDVRFWG
jgi:hypothetical protein